MEKLKRIPKIHYLLGHSLVAVVLTALVFLFHFPTALLALLVVPVAASAVLYSNRFYLWPMAAATICGLAVVLQVSAHVRTSSEMLVGLFLMSLLLCEFIYRQTQSQARLQAEISSLARFSAENPNPVLRLAPDGRVLYCNRGARALLNLWSSADDAEAPALGVRWPARSCRPAGVSRARNASATDPIRAYSYRRMIEAPSISMPWTSRSACALPWPWNNSASI